MGFIDSYKRLEKLCGDVMGCDRPVTAYIDEMNAARRLLCSGVGERPGDAQAVSLDKEPDCA